MGGWVGQMVTATKLCNSALVCSKKTQKIKCTIGFKEVIVHNYISVNAAFGEDCTCN